MNLYQYQKTRIQTGIHDLQESFQETAVSWIEQAKIAAEMKFRDRAGRYWYADIYDGSWFFYENGKWLLSSEVPEVLEGSASLFLDDGKLPEMLTGDQLPDPAGAGQAPVIALEDSFRKIRFDYQDGRLSSEAARMISRRHYVIDLQGGIWTVGLRSGDWYRMEVGGWEREDAPPAQDQLLKLDQKENPPQLPELADEAYGRLLDFLLRDPALPEDITSPWDPPDGVPDSTKAHFVRQEAARIFCPHCGEPIK